MTLPPLWIAVILGAVALLNLAATLEACLNLFMESPQRLRSVLLIWLAPVAGAVICLSWAWRNHWGLERKPDGEAVLEAAELAGLPGAARSRISRVRDSWDGDVNGD